RKKLVPATRSINCSTPAASSGGKASSSRNEVTSCAHTKNGKRISVIPFARRCRIVTMKLTDPRSDEVMRKIMPTSQKVCPIGAMSESGGYEVHPEFAEPPGTKKLANMITPPGA